jgi:hypothetical protein
MHQVQVFSLAALFDAVIVSGFGKTKFLASLNPVTSGGHKVRSPLAHGGVPFPKRAFAAASEISVKLSMAISTDQNALGDFFLEIGKSH